MASRTPSKKSARSVKAWRAKNPPLKDVLDPFVGSLRNQAARAESKARQVLELVKLQTQRSIAQESQIKVLTRRVLAAERQIDQDDRRLHELESRLPDVRLLVDQVHRLSERVQPLEHDASPPQASEMHEALRLQHRATNAQRAQTFAINEMLDRLKSAEENLRDHEQKLGALFAALGHAEDLPDLWRRLEENFSDKSPSATGSSKD